MVITVSCPTKHILPTLVIEFPGWPDIMPGPRPWKSDWIQSEIIAMQSFDL